MPGPDPDQDPAPTRPAEPTVTDGRLGEFTGYLMKRAFNVVQADLARALEPFGLRMLSFSALQVVAENPDITQTQLAQALSMERSNVVLVLDSLEQADLVTRNPVKNNRRAYALRATPAGRRTAGEARRAVVDHEARLFAGLSADELAALRRALAKIQALQP